MSRNLEAVAQLEVIARNIGITLPALACAWTLSVPGVSAAIVGARHPEQVDGWIDAGDIELDDDAVEAAEKVIEGAGAGVVRRAVSRAAT